MRCAARLAIVARLCLASPLLPLGCTEKGINVVMPLGPAHCPGVG